MGEVYALHNPIHQSLECLVDEPQGHDLVHSVLEVTSRGGVSVSTTDEDIVVGVKVSIEEF